MGYGIDPTRRKQPKQDWNTLIRQAARFEAASQAHQKWAEIAKKCFEYVEGKQWSEADAAYLRRANRPVLTLNKIRPLVRLVEGFAINNPVESRYLPSTMAVGAAAEADVINHLSKVIGEACDLMFVDTDVFLEGLIGGRAYWDCRLDFSENDFGDIRWCADDPFSTYIDPDCDAYDINKGTYVITSRWMSLEEIGVQYGPWAEAALSPVTPWNNSITPYGLSTYTVEEIAPHRTFGGEIGTERVYWGSFGAYGDLWYDHARKTVRTLDIQHYVWVDARVAIDLVSGDRQVIPDDWDLQRIRNMVAWHHERGQPVTVEKRKIRRLRWTHIAGDMILYDDWSSYRTFTKVPFFPWFRRGQTQGMVEDLLGPQDEINKRRAARLEITNRTANGGWMYPKGSLDPQQKANLERNGSRPGFHLEYNQFTQTVQPYAKPERLDASTVPIAQAQLEQDGAKDLHEISGLNESMLGSLDTVQSGHALQARQRQSILGLEGYIQNHRRSKKLCARKQLEIIQDHYTEERVVAVIGSDGRIENEVRINQRLASGAVVNNVTRGKYRIAITEEPLTKSHLAAQFEEMMRLKEAGFPIPDEFVVEASSFARKDELLAALAEQREREAMAAAAGLDPTGGNGRGPGPGGSRVGPDGGSMPDGEPGRPLPPTPMPGLPG